MSTYLSLPICLSRLRQAISLVHNRSIDYRLFTSMEARKLLKDTHRIVGIHLEEFPSLFSNLKSSNESRKNFCLQLTCTNFLHQMVRRLTTDLIQVGQGQLSLEQFEQRLNFPNETSINENQLLDIHGLYLQNVLYDEQDFQRYVTYTTLKTMRNKIYPLAPVLTGEE